MKTVHVHDVKASDWTGGRTWQLLILPQGSSLGERNFEYRLSTASIESDHSTFTLMPGFERYLVVLTEPIKLSINGSFKKLAPDTVLHFMGSDQIESSGHTQDFNLIKRAGLEGSLEMLSGELCGPAIAFDADKMALFFLEAGESAHFERAVWVKIPFT
ncbi:MAG: HutD family protein [Anaerolineaceae bacterium]|nr:HutD family protein [Anaerolineaceae bacterium]